MQKNTDQRDNSGKRPSPISNQINLPFSEEMLRSQLSRIQNNDPVSQQKIIDYFTMRGIKDGLAEQGLTTDLEEHFKNAMSVSGHHGYPSCSYIRCFCTSEPIPFSAFDGIRKSTHQVQLTATQEETVMKAFDCLVGDDEGKSGSPKISSTKELARRISDPHPFVSVFFDKLCPHLRSSDRSGPRSGTTYLLLSAITGHTKLCERCLNAGANPNNMSFLMEENPDQGEMFHGYSPVFIAVLAEQFEIMELMLSRGGSLHVYDRWGRTPLHAAVTMGNNDLVQWLLSKGAPKFVSDLFNYMPGDCASHRFTNEKTILDELMPPWTMRRCDVGCSNKGSQETSVKNVEDLEKLPKCHCLSGLPRGFCGCVDDMYLRWSRDRHFSRWSSGVDYSVLADRQKVVLEEQKNSQANMKGKKPQQPQVTS